MTEQTVAIMREGFQDARRPTRLPASIEVSLRQALESSDLPGLFPKGVRVYVTDLGTEGAQTMPAAARRLRALGYVAVPHIAARRIAGRAALEHRIGALADAGVSDVLVIGGGVAGSGGFDSTMGVLETGLFDRYGITDIAVAGHPGGSPDFSTSVADETLRLKQAFARRTGARMRIVTQFGFDPAVIVSWLDRISAERIYLPVHIGVAGPASIPTLLKFAAACGVGNSLNFLRKSSRSLATLAAGYSPQPLVSSIEDVVGAHPASPIRQIHIYPFGGIKRSAAWLREHGAWPPAEPAATRP